MAFKISVCWRRINRTIDVRWTNKCKHKQTDNATGTPIFKLFPQIEKKKKTNRETKREGQRQTSEKKKKTLASIGVPHLLPPFPYFWGITFTPLLQLVQHFRNTVGLEWSICSVRCIEQPQNCSPNFETKCKTAFTSLCSPRGFQMCLWVIELQNNNVWWDWHTGSEGFAGNLLAQCIILS